MKNETPVQSFDSGRVMGRQQVWKVIGLTLLVCGSLYGQRITSFDAPLAGTGPGQGTFPTAITSSGVIVGYVLDSTGVYHGFVGTPPNFTSIDATTLGVSTTASQYPVQGTQAISINQAGSIVGYYTIYAKSPYGNFFVTTVHNFLRYPNGTFINIDPTTPFFFGSSNPPNGYLNFINAAGVVAGNNGPYGFLYTPGANPAFISLPFIPTGINANGAITGRTNSGPLGYLRTPDGTITTFTPPGPLSQYVQTYYTVTTGINAVGAITGTSYDYYGQHGFVRAPDGTITAFDSPDTGTYRVNCPSCGYSPAFGGTTFSSAINPAGTVTGNYFVTYPVYTGQYSGFVWVHPPVGQFTTFDPPGSTYTTPTAINPAGAIIGNYSDSNSVVHGFLRTP
jgi:hypothetical protein